MRAVVPHGMKRRLAGLLAVLLLCGVFAGCKIEMPDDVAESVLAAASQGAETDSSALEELTSEGTSAGETPSDTTASQEDGGTSSSAAAQAEAPSVEQQKHRGVLNRAFPNACSVQPGSRHGAERYRGFGIVAGDGSLFSSGTRGSGKPGCG